ncbi:hypothetical protein GGF46_001082 [Coemansia sp. RSA 552]|nr:hypothetical protein GGF46_001082 [Coemansia sp. RSA 552]
MSAKPSVEMEDKKKARDDALKFLETLGDDDDGSDSGEGKQQQLQQQPQKEPGAEKEGKDAKGMLKFIDDLTESAKRSASPGGGEGTAPVHEQQPQEQPVGGWSWGGIWGQATALVEQNQQLKSGLGRLKESIDHVRNTDASKNIESRMRTLVTQENISRIGGDFKRGLGSVIDTIAPPIPEHEVFNVHLANNVHDSPNVESVVYRTMDSVFDFHGCGEINVKSAAKTLATAPEMQAKRGDTFTLPKGFDGGYGAAVSAVQLVQSTHQARAKEAEAKAQEERQPDEAGRESPLFYRAHKTELVVAIQPFSAIPIEDQDFLGLCVVLRDPSRGLTLRSFSQMLPLSCWAKPHDQIVAVDVDASLGSAVNMRTDSATHRRQEMNEECLYEAVMLAVKTVVNEYLTTRPRADWEIDARPDTNS